MDEELSNYPDAMKVRASTVEHPFGTIKLWMGITHFLMKRLENVQTEMSLHVLAYNMKRMISILRAAASIKTIQGHKQVLQVPLYGLISGTARRFTKCG